MIKLKLEEILILDASTIEYVDDNKDIICQLKEILKIFGEINELASWKKKDDYSNGIYLWIQNFYQYAREAYNNLVIGNLYSFYSGIRTVLENRIYFEYILKYKQENLLEKWMKYSYIKFIQEFPEAKEKEKNELLEEFIFDEGINEKKVNDYTWLKDLFSEKTYITIEKLCKKIDKMKLYKDYRDLSNYVHGQNHYVKTIPFTFYTSIHSKVIILVDAIVDYIELFSNEITGYEYLFEMISDKRNALCKKIQDSCLY